LLRNIDLSHFPQQQEIQNPNHQWFVYEEDDKVLGCVVAKENRQEIGHIAVDTDVLRKGIGSTLVNHCIPYLRSKSSKQVWAQVRVDNKASIGLFAKNGFKIEKKITSSKNSNLKLFRFILSNPLSVETRDFS
jgi:ribosomal protein S18 acetylase RimI-like enzyme